MRSMERDERQQLRAIPDEVAELGRSTPLLLSHRAEIDKAVAVRFDMLRRAVVTVGVTGSGWRVFPCVPATAAA